MFETEKTGIYAVGGEGDRWAFVHNGRVVWAGSREGCLERWAIIERPQKPAMPTVLEKAIRRLAG